VTRSWNMVSDQRAAGGSGGCASVRGIDCNETNFDEPSFAPVSCIFRAPESHLPFSGITFDEVTAPNT
jgi:hypothetical protein